jgi:eukaryotic-like serine/threonine-protein kinase
MLMSSPSLPVPPTPGLPAAIGRYRPVARLGAGAMGTVYQAHDPLIDRMVAIKVVRGEALDPDTEAAFLERFRQEVQAAGRCSHPAIVGVFDYLEEAGSPAIVMQLVEGRSLQQILRDPEARATLPAVPVLLQVLSGLGYAHGQGVIHRDIKPSNILITPEGQARIADFGIARLNHTSLTQAGVMLGTPQYMAPEQTLEAPVDHRADLFSVGVILYELLAGRSPFAGHSITEMIRRLIDKEEIDLAPLAASPALLPVARRALAKDPAHRFQSADAFAAALQSAASVEPPTVVAPALPRAAARGWDSALLQRVERHYAVHAGPLARKTVAEAARQAATTEELYGILARTLSDPAERSAFLRALGRARVEPSLTASRWGAPGPGPGASGVSPRLPPLPEGWAGAPPAAPDAASPTSSQALLSRTGAVLAGPPPTVPAAPAASSFGSLPPVSAAAPATLPPTTTRAAAMPGLIPADAMAAAQTALTFYIGPIARVLVRKAAADARSGTDFIVRLCAHVPKPDEALALRRRLRAEVEPKLGRGD